MSLQSWIEEFYTPIEEVEEKDALAHSLKKWEGALPENLAKHGMHYAHQSIVVPGDSAENTFEFNTPTCALCKFYFVYNEQIETCKGCPLHTMEGFEKDEMGCGRGSAYLQSSRDPMPMIELLQRAIKKQT